MTSHAHAVLRPLIRGALLRLAAFASVMSFASAPAAADDATMRAIAPAETSEVAPVWRLDVTQDSTRLTPQLVTNAFADSIRPHQFPLHDLPIDRVTESPSRRTSYDTSGIGVTMEVARLPVGSDGGIPPGPIGGFVVYSFASVDPWTGHTTFLCVVGPGASPNGCDPTQDFYVDLGVIPGEVLRWEVSPDGTWGVVHTSGEVAILSRDHPPIHTHLWPAIWGAFSRDGSKYVASTRVLLAGGPADRWSVIDRNGHVLREGPARPGTIDHLEFAPDGSSILLSWARDTSYRVLLDTGGEAPLPAGWWDDRHQVSADGRTDLGVRRTERGGATVRLFDCSDPIRPVALVEPLVLDHPVEAAAIAADGSLVALLEGEGEGESMRVTVYDRRLQRRALLLRHTQRGGLLFAGHELVVGTGPASRVARFNLQSSAGTLVYDLCGLMP